MIRIVCGASVFVEPSLSDASEDCKNAMLACYASGSRPIITDEISAREAAIVHVLGTSHVEIINVPSPDASAIEVLGPAYASERRDPARLVRADIGQAWTRYIQDQPGAVRQDAERAIGAWMVQA